MVVIPNPLRLTRVAIWQPTRSETALVWKFRTRQSQGRYAGRRILGRCTGWQWPTSAGSCLSTTSLRTRPYSSRMLPLGSYLVLEHTNKLMYYDGCSPMLLLSLAGGDRAE